MSVSVSVVSELVVLVFTELFDVEVFDVEALEEELVVLVVVVLGVMVLGLVVLDVLELLGVVEVVEVTVDDGRDEVDEPAEEAEAEATQAAISKTRLMFMDGCRYAQFVVRDPRILPYIPASPKRYRKQASFPYLAIHTMYVIGQRNCQENSLICHFGVVINKFQRR